MDIFDLILSEDYLFRHFNIPEVLFVVDSNSDVGILGVRAPS
jgi:hypothetical protein